MPDSTLPQPQRPQQNQPPRQPVAGSGGNAAPPGNQQGSGSAQSTQPRSNQSGPSTNSNVSAHPNVTPMNRTNLPTPKPPTPATQQPAAQATVPARAPQQPQQAKQPQPSQPQRPPQLPAAQQATQAAPAGGSAKPSAPANSSVPKTSTPTPVPNKPSVAPKTESSPATPVTASPPTSGSSRLMQNLKAVSAEPFRDPQSPATSSAGTISPVASSVSPSVPSPTPSSGVPATTVPKESLSLDPLNPDKKPLRTPATAGSTGTPGKARKFLIGIAALVVLVVAGVGGWFFLANRGADPSTPNTPSVPGTQKNVTLTYWGLWESDEILQPLIDTYEQQNPGVKINYVQQNSRQYRQRLQAAIRDGSGPDLFRYHNSWVPMLQSDLAAAPTSVLTPASVERDYYPVVKTDIVKGNQVLGMPLMYDGLALLYNKNMLEAANALPPSDWQQVRELATRLTIKNGNRIERGGIALGTADNVDHFSDILALMMLQNSADPGNPVTANAQTALEFYTIFSRVDGVWDNTQPPSTQAFASEQVAMIFAPSWRIHEIQEMNPNLNIGVARVPQIDGMTLSWATYWIEGVSSTSKQKEEAWKFLAYLGQAEQLRKFHTSASSQRAQGELYPRVDMASELKTDALLAPYLDDALIAKSWYMASATYDDGLNDGLIQYYKDAVNSMNSGGSAERALQTVLPGIQQVLSRYGLGNVSGQQ